MTGKILIWVLLAGLAAGCSEGDKKPVNHAPVHFTQTNGVVTFTSAKSSFLAGRPVKIYYNIPQGADKTTAPVLIALHGNTRSASNNPGAGTLNYWVRSSNPNNSNAKNFMVFVPEFTSEIFSGSQEYNQGGMFKSTNYTIANLREQQDWTFSLIEEIFDFIVSDLGGSQKKYDIWGHSAGGQFVHRYVMFTPEARINRAVAANPGWYTFPDYSPKPPSDRTNNYPCGLVNSPAGEDYQKWISKAYSKNLTIQLGDRDIDASSSDFTHTVTINGQVVDLDQEQGTNRFARGNAFWDFVSGAGAQEFNWSRRVVEGVGHNQGNMAADAAKYLYP